MRQKNAARRFRAAEVVEKGFGMFETSLRHVSGLTCPWLYAIGQADSVILCHLLCYMDALPRTLIIDSVLFAGLCPRIHCVGFDPTMPSEKKIFNLVFLKGWT